MRRIVLAVSFVGVLIVPFVFGQDGPRKDDPATSERIEATVGKKDSGKMILVMIAPRIDVIRSGTSSTTISNQYFGIREEAKTALQAGDDIGLKEMEDAGKIMIVEGGTRGHVVERYAKFQGSAYFKVRMLEGPKKDKAGWIDGKSLVRVDQPKSKAKGKTKKRR